MAMFDIYSNERESAAFGGYANDDYGRGGIAGTTSPQTAEVENVGDFSAKNWVIAFMILFLFLYTVSRLLD